jgi:ribosome-associated protein
MSSLSPTTITIQSDVIELCQILKFEGLVSSGGEAKQVIVNELVKVNGETETRKRRKIFHGDTIEYQGSSYLVAGPTAS